jgi:hypothetical protein
MAVTPPPGSSFGTADRGTAQHRGRVLGIPFRQLVVWFSAFRLRSEWASPRKSLAAALMGMPGNSQTEYRKACNNNHGAPGRRNAWPCQAAPHARDEGPLVFLCPVVSCSPQVRTPAASCVRGRRGSGLRANLLCAAVNERLRGSWPPGRTWARRCPGVAVVALFPFNIPAWGHDHQPGANLTKLSADSCARLGGNPGSARWRPRRRLNGHHGA